MVRVYSRSGARQLFRDFAKVKIEVEQLTPKELIVGSLLPKGVFRAIRRSVGWNVVITATK